jgi:Ca2+-binding EF-hand superfamily protein
LINTFSRQDFVLGLSTLSRGSLEEKLRWTFGLYDINGDGCITREEMTDIVTAVYDLMGKFTDPFVDEAVIKEKVDKIFQVNKIHEVRKIHKQSGIPLPLKQLHKLREQKIWNFFKDYC